MDGLTIGFAGYSWRLKESVGRVGPGPNHFSAGPRNVWVDDAGALHLAVTREGDAWQCAEVILQANLGYGTYRFEVGCGVSELPIGAILGLFTWSDPEPNREIDIELGRWGNGEGVAEADAQYCVQPYELEGHLHRFPMPPGVETAEHSFTWLPGRVSFWSYTGHCAEAMARPTQQWVYEGDDVPQPGPENVRINLWLVRGKPPVDGQPFEVVIRGFEFTPAEQGGRQ